MTLPHSPRHIVFPPSGSRTPALPESIHLLYSPQSSVILRLDPSTTPHLSIVELPTDPPRPTADPSSSMAGSSSHVASSSEAGGSVRAGVGGALSGLGGYVGLGGKAVIPVGTGTVGGEVLVARDGEQESWESSMMSLMKSDLGVFLSSEGNYTRNSSLQWPAPPDCLGTCTRHNDLLVADCVQLSLTPTSSLSRLRLRPVRAGTKQALSCRFTFRQHCTCAKRYLSSCHPPALYPQHR